MNRHLVLALAFALTAFAAPSGAEAEPSKEPAATVSAASLRTQLIASLRADLAAAKKGEVQEDSRGREALAQSLELIARDSAAAGLSDGSQPGGIGDSWLIMVRAHGSEQSVTLAEQFVARIQEERASAEADLLAKGEAIGKRASVAVFQAKNASELDLLLQDMGRVAVPLGQQRSSAEASSLATRLQTLGAFIQNWQTYLSLRETGSSQEALQRLRNFGAARDVGWIPGSEVARQMVEAARQCGKPVVVTPFDPQPVIIGTLLVVLVSIVGYCGYRRWV
jgi:hypothetical protein